MKKFSLLIVLAVAGLIAACGEPPQLEKEDADAALPALTKPPVLTSIADQSTNEDATLSNVPVKVNDEDSNLVCTTALSASSSNVAVIKSSKVTFSGTTPNCFMTVVPEANANGIANITVTASDGIHQVNTKVKVTVNAVNDAPTIGAISAKTTERNTATATINFTIADIDSTLNCATSLSMVSSNPSVVTSGDVVFAGTAPNCTAIINPVEDAIGTSTIGFVVSDGALHATSAFNLNVVAENQAPTISNIADRSTNEDTPTASISFVINDADGVLSCTSSMTMVSSDVSKVSSSAVVFSGTAPNCSAVVTPVANAFGVVNLTFQVSDGNKSATDVFALTINAVNDAPVLSPVATQATAVDIPKSFNFTINDIDNSLSCSSSYLSMSSTNSALINDGDITFSGTAPNCSAILTPNTGVAGSAQLTLTLSDGSLVDSETFTFNVLGELEIDPVADDIQVGGQITFTAFGGTGSGYNFSIISGGGSIDSSTGVFTAPSTADTVVIRLVDSGSNFVEATINVYEAISLTPLTGMVVVNDTYQLTAAGGLPPYSFNVDLGNGSIDGNGLFTAAPAAGSVTVSVTDADSNTASATIEVVSLLTISPASLALPVFSTHTFLAAGGTSPYTFSLASGTGSFNTSTGLLTAPSTTGSAVIQVADSGIQTKQSNVTYVKPTKLSAGANHVCALYDNGGVKCWGSGADGRLGNGSTASIGDNAEEIGGSIPFVDLGTGRTATDVSAGNSHTCALLDNAKIKCWGNNNNGKLGYGDTASRGDASNEMGDSLLEIDLGTGKTAKAVEAGNDNTCAILNDDTLKCWGGNASGQLGVGNTTSIFGDGLGEMGNSLPVVNLGTDKTVKKVAMAKGADAICAILNDDTLKCWGNSSYGRLGNNSNTNHLGDAAGEMGNSLPALLSGAAVADVSMGLGHVCVFISSTPEVRCWGYNSNGQLGANSTSNINSSTSATSLGANTIGVTGFTPNSIYTSGTSSCASSSANNLRCWGSGAFGIRLSGGTTNVGDHNSRKINSVSDMPLGSSVTIKAVALGNNFGCIISNTDRIKCWGDATGGIMLNANVTNHLGDAAGETGDAVPWLNH